LCNYVWEKSHWGFLKMNLHKIIKIEDKRSLTDIFGSASRYYDKYKKDKKKNVGDQFSYLIEMENLIESLRSEYENAISRNRTQIAGETYKALKKTNFTEIEHGQAIYLNNVLKKLENPYVEDLIAKAIKEHIFSVFPPKQV